MLRIKPFAAIRPEDGQAARVASLPYDVVSTDEARAIARANPDSFIRVVRSEVDLPPDADPYAPEVYQLARRNLDRLIETGRLGREDGPRLYLYRQVMDHVAQVGLVACCHIEDYQRNVIRKHEKTRRVKEDDRTRHVLALNANSGPVFLTYRDRPAIDELVESAMQQRPTHHFDADDGVTHTVWAIGDAAPFVEAFARVPAAYVADGHHRSASAARAGAERAAANPGHTGDEQYNWFMAVLFPASQLRILAYNRVVTDLAGKAPADVLGALAGVGTVTPASDPVPGAPGRFCAYLDGSWHEVTFDPASIDRDDPVGSLDVALLEDRVLGPILGIGDVRADPRIDFVGGIRGTGELERRVDSGEFAMAFSMYPTTVEQLMAVSDADRIMPPKSTWFEPKLRSGLFVHELS